MFLDSEHPSFIVEPWQKGESPPSYLDKNKKKICFAVFAIASMVLGFLAYQGKLGGDIPNAWGGANLGLYAGFGLPVLVGMLACIKMCCCRMKKKQTLKNETITADTFRD